jgi:predicted NBD/HSP70 family sugar kinase
MNINLQDIGIIAAAITAIASLIVAWSSRRKNINDAAEAVSRAATSLVDPLNEQICNLKTDVEKLAEENSQLREWVQRQYAYIAAVVTAFNILTQQVILLGGKPAVDLPEPLDISTDIRDAVLVGRDNRHGINHPGGGRGRYSPDGGGSR